MVIGIYFGIYVLFTIGLYHILIRVLEKRFGTLPWIGFMVLGIICCILSLTASKQTTSMWWGYNAFINLWSVKEMFEQKKRSLA
ncbi:MAG: DUF4491 domain-containing protein [Firmicutes bacterium HGW-Firmicutes-15]|nr:MAG: DUF4491 domain-containing protein [Firmicutes bacterium HGW-Firmicutes-15]